MGILTLERLAPSGRLAAAFRARTSENTPSTHLGEYRSNSQGATYGCAPRRPRRGEDSETESRIRYNAFQTHQRNVVGGCWERTETPTRTRTGRSGCYLQTTKPCSG